MRLLLLIILMTKTPNLIGQDSIAGKERILSTYSFDIENGKLIGDGGDFLKKEMSKAQFTLLGEYHNSTRISEFTNAIIPVLDSLQYKTIVLEVGQHAGKFIDEIRENPEKELIAVYDKYKFTDKFGDSYLPFPFLEYQEDLPFFNAYKSRGWKTIGVDQEYYDGLVLLFDIMYNNLSKNDQKKYSHLHDVVVDSLNMYYAKDYNDDESIMAKIHSTPIISEYFSSIGTAQQNKKIIESIKLSAEIYQSNWYTNYNLRVQHMKNNLRVQLSENNFDVSTDKLVAKMGAYHLSKGFSLWGAYEIGNTFNELAFYHGNSSLNIAFLRRYYQEEGVVKDLMNSDDERNKRYNELLQHGEEDKWIIIDLRPIKKKYVSQSSDYTFNKYVEEYMKTYDLIIIPKTEMEPNSIIKQ